MTEAMREMLQMIIDEQSKTNTLLERLVDMVDSGAVAVIVNNADSDPIPTYVPRAFG